MRLYRLDAWIHIKDREGLAKALSLPKSFSGEALSKKMNLSYDPIYGDADDMMHFFHGSDIPQGPDIIDYDMQNLYEISRFLDSGGITVYPFTGKEAYSQYLIRDGQVIKMEASIIWHVPDTYTRRKGDPAFSICSVEKQIEGVWKKQNMLFSHSK